MAADLAESSFMQHQDLVHALDGRQPVRDGDGRAAGHQPVQRVLNQELGFGVDARRRLIEHQNGWRERERSGEREQLLLTHGEGRAPLRDRAV